ncbi:hypothetical protein BCPG3_045 [Bacillus phage BCPG3]|uniref:Uncharacterized protein n=2 Tax=Wphvirus BPS13 TaxID=1987727 RepID=A0A173GBV9_9CAUD|nr:hypothetical protein [Bacillus thuringiensis]YP_006907583.1 hypothetical protein BPS13_0024 [Bacillus phage BPS13]YP_009282006.1 hypothetical protein SALINJAH_52 [Bacillus phage SalinJah]QQO38958.1 hypothetical protein BCPG1_227 [Bacillus phage BCPG1]QSJ04362.1 hypothetical protein BCPG3_045 [Bacillus phage BCPG3]QSJ04575.1 hypothetical protein BCP18_043 [Bacillus phage BCP18]AEZ50203.1 hypothetical protein BPS13_0024 [Bacillus phage BPS13]ANH50695.1 hypothetical protein SALINJAH_52 [Baci
MHISVNYGHVEGRDFDTVIRELEYEFGYEGPAWEMIVASGDMEILAEFLEEDGLAVELDGEELY